MCRLQYRLNFKANVVPYTTMFAHASGFKIAWELPVRGAREARSSTTRTTTLEEIREAAENVYERYIYICIELAINSLNSAWIMQIWMGDRAGRKPIAHCRAAGTRIARRTTRLWLELNFFRYGEEDFSLSLASISFAKFWKFLVQSYGIVLHVNFSMSCRASFCGDSFGVEK